MEINIFPLWCFVLSLSVLCALLMIFMKPVTGGLVAQLSIYDADTTGRYILMYRDSPQELNETTGNSALLLCENGGFYHELHKCVCKPGFTGQQCEKDTEQCSSHPCQHDGRCVDDAEGYHCICMPGYSGKNCGRRTGHHRVKRSTSSLLCSRDQVKRHDNITSYCSVHDPTNAVTCYIPPCDPFLVPIFDLTGFSHESFVSILIKHRQQVIAGIALGSPRCTDYLDISDMFEPVFFPVRQSVAGMYVVSPETKHGISHIPLNIFIDESLSPGTPCNDGRGLETTTLVPPTRSQSSSTFSEESSNTEDPTTDPKKVNNADKPLDTAWIILNIIVIVLFIIVIVLCIILRIGYVKYVELQRVHGSARRGSFHMSVANGSQVTSSSSPSVDAPFISRNGTSNSH